MDGDSQQNTRSQTRFYRFEIDPATVDSFRLYGVGTTAPNGILFSRAIERWTEIGP